MKRLVSTAILVCLPIFAVFSQYTFTTIKSGLPYPVSFALDPSGNYYVTLKGGSGFGIDSAARVDVFDPTGVKLGEVWDFTDSIETYFERGVLGVAIDPDFSTNSYVYVLYNHDSPVKIRVMRFTMVANNGTNPTIILDLDDPHSAGNHTGGNIHFRPTENDKLYVTMGDRATQPNSQMLTNPWGKILRINKDGTIPTDNPYYDDGDPDTGNDDRIWAYGLRNSFDFTFSAVNDSMYISENGWNTMDEVNQGIRGGNYGWADCEGTVPNTGGCTDPSFLAPIQTFGPVGTGLPSVTGIIIYSSNVMSEFDNHLLVATYTDETIRDVELGNAPMYDTEVSTQTIFSGQLTNPVDLIQGPEGCIYVLEGGYTTNGRIRTICPDDLGTVEKDAMRVRMWPNPAEDRISVFYEGVITNAQIMGMNGQLVKEVGQITNEIDVHDLESGLYMIRFFDQDGKTTVKQMVKM